MVRLKKPDGRFGPRQHCIICHKPFNGFRKYCSDYCLGVLIQEHQECKDRLYHMDSRHARIERECQETITAIRAELRERDEIIEHSYKDIDAIHAMLDMANVPSGGLVLDRLGYLIEQFLYYRQHVPRIFLIERD